jgi:putative ABC transport system ATP-binding protein
MLGTDAVLVVDHLSFGYPGRDLLRSVSFELREGEFMSVVGPSGSGKSTLLHCIAGILEPDHGSVTVGGTLLTDLPASRRAAFRLAHIGMVFQFGELLPELPVVENVSLPLVLAGRPRSEADALAAEVLERLGLGPRAAAMPETLSGGEVQRTAIARALVTEPALVVADEPTGMLDGRTSTAVVAELRGLAAERGTALLVATHDHEVAALADIQAHLDDGHLLSARGSDPAGRPGSRR